MRACDDDENGSISYDEFQRHMSQDVRQKPELTGKGRAAAAAPPSPVAPEVVRHDPNSAPSAGMRKTRANLENAKEVRPSGLSWIKG